MFIFLILFELLFELFELLGTLPPPFVALQVPSTCVPKYWAWLLDGPSFWGAWVRLGCDNTVPCASLCLLPGAADAAVELIRIS